MISITQIIQTDNLTVDNDLYHEIINIYTKGNIIDIPITWLQQNVIINGHNYLFNWLNEFIIEYPNPNEYKIVFSPTTWANFTLDENNNIVLYMDYTGLSIHKEYNSTGKIVLEQTFGPNYPHHGLVCYYEYDDNDNCTYYHNSNDFWTKSEYDQNNNVIKYSDGYGITINQYDKQNNIIYSASTKTINNDKKNTTITYYKYDNQNRCIEKVVNGKQLCKFIYDDKRNTKIQINHDSQYIKKTYDNRGNIILNKHSDGTWTKYEYNDNNQNTLYEYSGGLKYTQEYDSNGIRIKYVHSQNKNGPETHITEYWPNGQLKRYDNVYIPLYIPEMTR